MQHIDKTARQNDALAIINNLLNDCWVDTKYSEANYTTLCKPIYRKPFVEILLQEQKNVCCYCMKMLANDHHTTLEHIVPHHCNDTEFNKYTAIEITQHVIHTDGFNYSDHKVPPPRYPHDIAYHNLSASCDSKSHCNNFRSNSPIKVLIYDVDLSVKVEYDLAGNAYSQDYFEELNTLGISSSSELVLFRKLWSSFANTKQNADEVNDDDIREKILEMVAMDGNEKLLEDMFDYPSKRDVFMEYKWFFNYYKRNN